jgi:hypothetical protein
LVVRKARLAVAGLFFAAILAACVPAPPPPPPILQTCSPYWRGYVVPSDHNYAGIGAYNGSDRYMCKPSATRGIRAQMQHLRNYADAASVSTSLGAPFEPRPKYDAYAFDTFPYKGSAPTWQGLEGRWAVPGTYYWDRISEIYNEMRVGAGLPPLSTAQLVSRTIMGPSELTAKQMAARVCAVGRCATWKPEVRPTLMALTYLSEGAKAGVRGDIAFCQSILETGWFAWPSSPEAATVPAPEPTTTTTTVPGSTTTTVPGSTTTTVPGATTTTTVPAPPVTAPPTAPPRAAPAIDPVLAAYFDLQRVTIRY